MNADSRARLNRTPEWTALARHREDLADTHLRDLFAADPGRGSGYTLRVGDLHIDYPKHLITADHASFGSGTELFRAPLNQRATYQWMA